MDPATGSLETPEITIVYCVLGSTEATLALSVVSPKYKKVRKGCVCVCNFYIMIQLLLYFHIPCPLPFV